MEREKERMRECVLTGEHGVAVCPVPPKFNSINLAVYDLTIKIYVTIDMYNNLQISGHPPPMIRYSPLFLPSNH